MAGGAIRPFGGGAGGISIIRHNKDLEADNSSISRVLNESKRDDTYALKFVISMTSNLNFGFQYQYKQSENHLHGSFFLNNNDRTYYKAFLSGYRLGVFYFKNKFGLGLFTAPPMRGKSLIDGENKIVAEPGTHDLP